jgi:hypothetical protein
VSLGFLVGVDGDKFELGFRTQLGEDLLKRLV